MNTSEERPEVEQNSKGKAEMVWTFAEKGWWIYWTKDAKYGAAKQEMEKKKTTQKIDGCSEWHEED